MQPWQIAIAGLVLLLGLLLGLRVSAWRRSRKGRRVALRGAEGEERALELLAAEGYRVLEVQPRAVTEVDVDGETVVFDLRLDAIVKRGKTRYIAEFKDEEQQSQYRQCDPLRHMITPSVQVST